MASECSPSGVRRCPARTARVSKLNSSYAGMITLPSIPDSAPDLPCGQKKPAFSQTKAGAIALAVFVRRPQAEIKSAQLLYRAG
jgi:hypothetical protein